MTNPPAAPLSPEQIEALKAFDTPTIVNALELLGVREGDRTEGIMSPRIRPIFPNLPPMVGYAATLMFETRQRPRGKFQVNRDDYWRYILTVPAPRISVGQDIDPPPSPGSMWGEVQASIHMALGCVGVILEGGVRDLPPMEAMGYPCFAREVIVGHAYAHLIDFGNPVYVGDLLVRSGDLLHADRHGIVMIPHDVAPRLAEACRTIVEVEQPLLAVCRDRENFTLERLIEAYNEFEKTYPTAKPRNPAEAV